MSVVGGIEEIIELWSFEFVVFGRVASESATPEVFD